VNKAAVGQVFSEYFDLPLSALIPSLDHNHIYDRYDRAIHRECAGVVAYNFVTLARNDMRLR
jgi:hypothetical protein